MGRTSLGLKGQDEHCQARKGHGVIQDPEGTSETGPRAWAVPDPMRGSTQPPSRAVTGPDASRLHCFLPSCLLAQRTQPLPLPAVPATPSSLLPASDPRRELFRQRPAHMAGVTAASAGHLRLHTSAGRGWKEGQALRAMSPGAQALGWDSPTSNLLSQHNY